MPSPADNPEPKINLPDACELSAARDKGLRIQAEKEAELRRREEERHEHVYEIYMRDLRARILDIVQRQPRNEVVLLEVPIADVRLVHRLLNTINAQEGYGAMLVGLAGSNNVLELVITVRWGISPEERRAMLEQMFADKEVQMYAPESLRPT